MDPAVTHALLQRMRSFSGQESAIPSGGLSPQENRVMTLVAEGKTNKEIALKMGLSEKTVKNYLSNILQKMQVSAALKPPSCSNVNAAAARVVRPDRLESKYRSVCPTGLFFLPTYRQ
jgi:DNA-binding NarL/FixJ family response regulator